MHNYKMVQYIKSLRLSQIFSRMLNRFKLIRIIFTSWQNKQDDLERLWRDENIKIPGSEKTDPLGGGGWNQHLLEKSRGISPNEPSGILTVPKPPLAWQSLYITYPLFSHVTCF